MVSDFIIFGFFSELQNYLQTETNVPLLLRDYQFNNSIIQKCYFYSESLQFSPDLIKKLNPDQDKYFALLYNRRAINVTNYRKFNIRAYDKETLAQLIELGALPEDYPGKVRIVSLTLLVRPYSSVLSYQFEVEELFLIDWVGRDSIIVSVPLNSEMNFTVEVGLSFNPYEEFDKDNPMKKVYSGSFEVELTFPLVKLNPKSPVIQTVNTEITTILYN